MTNDQTRNYMKMGKIARICIFKERIEVNGISLTCHIDRNGLVLDR